MFINALIKENHQNATSTNQNPGLKHNWVSDTRNKDWLGFYYLLRTKLHIFRDGECCPQADLGQSYDFLGVLVDKPSNHRLIHRKETEPAVCVTFSFYWLIYNFNKTNVVAEVGFTPQFLCFGPNHLVSSRTRSRFLTVGFFTKRKHPGAHERVVRWCERFCCRHSKETCRHGGVGWCTLVVPEKAGCFGLVSEPTDPIGAEF